MLSVLIEALTVPASLVYIYTRHETVDDRITELVSKSNPSLGKQAGVEDLSDIIYIMKSTHYKDELEDYTQYPEVTLETLSGDCEDLSVLSYSLLDYLELNPGILVAWSPDDTEAHAVTFFFCPYCNEYYIFSNNDVFRAKDLPTAVDMLGFEEYKYTYEAEIIKHQEVV